MAADHGWDESPALRVLEIAREDNAPFLPQLTAAQRANNVEVIAALSLDCCQPARAADKPFSLLTSPDRGDFALGSSAVPVTHAAMTSSSVASGLPDRFDDERRRLIRRAGEQQLAFTNKQVTAVGAESASEY